MIREEITGKLESVFDEHSQTQHTNVIELRVQK